MASNDETSGGSDTAELRSINEKTLMGVSGGSTFQIVTLPNGDQVPTGTVAAVLVNIKTYDEASKRGDKIAMKDLEQQIGAALPVLKKIGMFDLFKPEEWTHGESEGRKLIGRLAAK